MSDEAVNAPVPVPPHDAVQQQPVVTNPPWVDQLLENQARDYQLRAEQLALSKQQLEQTHEYSKLALDAQVTDRREWRQMWSGLIDRITWRIIIVVALALAFLSVLVLSGHDQIALELVRVVFYGGFGAWGGYGYHASKTKKNSGL